MATLPPFLAPLIEDSPGANLKLLAAWEGLSVESQIAVLDSFRASQRASTREVALKALASANAYVRYLSGASVDPAFLNDEHARDGRGRNGNGTDAHSVGSSPNLRASIETDPDPLVRYAPLERDYVRFGEGEDAVIDKFLRLPLEARLATLRGGLDGESFSRIVRRALGTGLLPESELVAMAQEYVGPLALPDIVKSKPTESDLLASRVIEQRRLTEAGLLASLVVQFTGRCNLRCVYCPQGTHLNTHNNDDAEAKLLYEVAVYIEEQQIDSVHLGVYGETLIYDDWPGIAESFLKANASLTMTTNLATHLSDEELDLLTRFKLIFVSIDTLDLPLLKTLRTVDGKLILYNFHLVRAWAIQHGRPIPDFAWSCTLSTAAIAHLEDMLPLAKRYGVKYLFLNDLSSYEGLKHGLKNVFELEGSEFDTGAATLDRVLAFCARAGIQVHAPWKERLDKEREKRKNGSAARRAADTADTTQLLPYNNIQGAAVWYSEALARGMTRMCLQPWNSMVVMPKGDIYTCCQRGVSMGRVNSAADFDRVRNNVEYVDLRRQLISGQVTDETCRNCQTMRAVTPDKLIDAVRNSLASRDAKGRQ